MSIDRIFLDANILFSLAYGSPSLDRLWELAEKGNCELLVSRYVIEEAILNLTEPNQTKKLNTCLSEVRVVLEADPRITCPIDLPGKDKPVLMAAISAGANYLVTGDVAHFGRYFGQTIDGVKICMVREYLRFVR
jgi:predicted nucleic acid-binding protein